MQSLKVLRQLNMLTQHVFADSAFDHIAFTAFFSGFRKVYVYIRLG